MSAVDENQVNRGLIWGIKNSFCSYVLTQADGGCDLHGAQYLQTGEFFFPLNAVDESDGPGALRVLRFSGSADFSAHGGMMRVSIADPALIRGIEVDERESEYEGTWSWDLTVGDENAGRVVLAHLRGDEDFPLGRTVTLSKEGAALFGGHYMPGEQLDPLLVVR